MITFGLLGLGRVIEKRVANVFLKELNNSKVIGVFDTNRKSPHQLRPQKFLLILSLKNI